MKNTTNELETAVVTTDKSSITNELTNIPSKEFVVIKDEEMKEISTFLSTEHEKMLSNFSKSQSNYMDTLMVFNAQTPIRNLRQISAEIEKKKMALAENNFRLQKDRVELKKLVRDMRLREYDDDLDAELLEIEITEKNYNIQQSVTYIESALKTVLNMKQQYESILKEKGIEDVSELDFEAEEEEYHIKQACHQAFEDIVATGRISVGNNKYLLQIGLMPNVIHLIWSQFLASPFAEDKKAFYDVINTIYDEHKGCSIKEANLRGMDSIFHENSVVQLEHNHKEIKETQDE